MLEKVDIAMKGLLMVMLVRAEKGKEESCRESFHLLRVYK